eukprot:2315030-Pleurochrysis_carterae.AAC.2
MRTIIHILSSTTCNPLLPRYNLICQHAPSSFFLSICAARPITQELPSLCVQCDGAPVSFACDRCKTPLYCGKVKRGIVASALAF